MSAATRPRLRSVVALIPGEASCVADVGAGHGALAAHLALAGDREVIATELPGGPIAELRHNLGRWQVSERVDVRCGRGLRPLSVAEVDCAVVAGVGAHTALSIASEAPAARVRWLVLQCMQRDELVSPWLRLHGWRVVMETEAEERGRRYCARLVEVAA